MNRKVTRSLLLVLALLYVPLSWAQGVPQVRVSVAPVRSGHDSWKLQATLTNLGDQPISVTDANVPWARYAMVVTAVEEKRPSSPLKVGFPIEDPLFNAIVIPARGAISGTIDLRDYFPDLPESLRRSRVIVMWSYSLRTEVGGNAERQYGGFVLPNDATTRTTPRP
jgi:hypothetical protein